MFYYCLDTAKLDFIPARQEERGRREQYGHEEGHEDDDMETVSR